MKTFRHFLLYLVLVTFSTTTFAELPPQNGDDLMAGYYGRPSASSLGVLGQHSIEELMPLIKAKAAEYDQINGEPGVIPVFHLIYGLTTGDPARKGDWPRQRRAN